MPAVIIDADIMSSSTPVFDLKNVLAELIRDGLVARHDAEHMYIGTRTRERAEAHPLQLVAEQKWQSAEPVPRPLTIEVLMEWLARKTGLSYYHIDPLKIDAPKVCAMVSHGFATRYKILPVDVNTREVVIATANPYDCEWEKQLEHATRLSIRRVVSNPQDIVRYLGEFYSLSRSLKGASKVQTGAGIGVASFEQLVELGKMGSLDANDQHIVTVVDWLLQYAYDQGASDIHLEPRRDSGNVRFRIDGVMHLVHQIPTAVLNAVTNRIKLLSRMDIVENAARRMAGSRPAPRAAKKSSCGYRPCRPHSAKSWCCVSSTRRYWSNRFVNWASPTTNSLPGKNSSHNRTASSW